MLWLLLFACADGPEPVAPIPAVDRPDILLITIDTLRADRVGAYGDALAATPNLDKLAAGGALFREAHSVTPLTLPSHASILTGLYPVHHGLRDNAGFRLGAATPTLAEALHAVGYRTGAFVSAYVLDGAWGLDQGFDVYRDPFLPPEGSAVSSFGEVELPSAEVVNAAAAWWREGALQDKADPTGVKSPPRFAWVHLYDPHTPWEASSDWEGDPYRGEVHRADGALRRLIDTVGEQTLVIATSDHGEGLWDEGEREHGILLGRGVTRVPLIIRPPGGIDHPLEHPAARPGAEATRRPAEADPTLDLSPVPDAPVAARIVEVPVSGVDIAPTIADWAGVALPGVDGRSLRAAVEGEPLTRDPIYAETWFPWFHLGWQAMVAAQDGSWRLERGARDALFDWRSDPAGKTVVTEPEALARLEPVIEAGRGTEAPTPGTVEPEQAAALQALGYLTEVVEPPRADAPDPRDRIDRFARMNLAAGLEDPAAAIVALEGLVKQEPQMQDARIALGLARARAGDLEGALADTVAVLNQQPNHPLAINNAGTLARQLGRDDEALLWAKRLIALNPRDIRGYRLEAVVMVDKKDIHGVLDATRSGLELVPEDPNLHYLAALAEIEAGDPLAGVSHLEAARKNNSKANDLDMWFGVAYERAGKIDEAKAAYEAATRSMPQDLRPWAMAGWMLYKAGRCPDALPFLVNVAKRGAAGDPKVMEGLGACQKKK